ncbi:MAG: hypothetical protein ACR2MX_08540 [Cyclobacteriaceae bacterium]
MQIFLVIAHLVLLGWITSKVYARYGDGLLKPTFFPALLFKLGAGVLLGVIFRYYYGTGDTWALFLEATTFAEQGYAAPLEFLQALFLNDYAPALKASLVYIDQPRALLAAKVISLFNLITYNHYWLVSLYLSLFSFISFWLLARKLVDYFPKAKLAIAAAFLFFPSVIFWSSGVSKESLVMGGICTSLALLLPLLVKNERLKPWHWILVVLGLLMVTFIKYYYAAVLIPMLIVVLIIGGKQWRLSKKVLTAFGLLIILLVAASWLHPNLHLDRLLFVVVANGQEMIANTSGTDYIVYHRLTPEFSSVAMNFPLAVFSGLFRPTLMETKTIFQLWTGLENAFLLVFALAQLTRWKTIDHTILLWAAIIYVLLLAGFLALAAPNFGTLVRYKIGFWPFLVFLILAGNPWLKIRSRFAQ